MLNEMALPIRVGAERARIAKVQPITRCSPVCRALSYRTTMTE